MEEIINILSNQVANLTEDLNNMKKVDEAHHEMYCELQEENKQLTEEIKAYQDMYFDKVMIIDKAIEYMKPRFMNVINDDKRYFADYHIQELYEILKGDNDE